MTRTEVLVQGDYEVLMDYVRAQVPQDSKALFDLVIASRTPQQALYQLRSGQRKTPRPQLVEALLPHLLPGCRFAIVRDVEVEDTAAAA